MANFAHAHTKLGAIADEDLRGLIDEIHQLRRGRAEGEVPDDNQEEIVTSVQNAVRGEEPARCLLRFDDERSEGGGVLKVASLQQFLYIFAELVTLG